ncbi:MAPEG family protein [Methylophaga pinxianii]|uniref:MAPEG family protein n=1 Tax=Methylophaga pinxianii TaxID=2881052 RepID=UPI001CF5C634|nr:MAPEG family protein [Methylophaga pinxianii]MCB2427271.1 MAPEG family protein [Methylophaga pinxianii]UPH46461.1 MAPEG family protein [Methylophaga pinxianii]
MISGIYAALAALLIVGLARNVIRLRRQYKVALGDGGNGDLLAAIRAHANAVEYLPIGLLLLLIFELNQGPIWLLHLLGSMFIIGRLIHAYGVSKAIISRRIIGMQMTLWLLIIMAVLNLFAFAGFQLAS